MQLNVIEFLQDLYTSCLILLAFYRILFDIRIIIETCIFLRFFFGFLPKMNISLVFHYLQ